MGRKKRLAVQYSSVILLIFADYLIDFAVVKHLQPVSVKKLIPGVIRLRYTQNTGMAFSIMSDKPAVLSCITACMILAGLIWLFFTKSNDPVYRIAAPCIIAGGAANLIDRLVYGFVIDYIEPEFVNFAVFNFPDILVTCGCFAIAIRLIWLMITDKTQNTT